MMPLCLVFLHLLEYFEGVLILTTNRIAAFDKAFKSRIHVAIHFPTLTSSARAQIWRTFLLRVPGVSADTPLLSPQTLDLISQPKLNGRQIRNVVRTAHAMAKSDGVQLACEHIKFALRSMEHFELEFEKRRVESLEDEAANGQRSRKRNRLSDEDMKEQ
jgi:AAA+ superfamily predicted ATPase